MQGIYECPANIIQLWMQPKVYFLCLGLSNLHLIWQYRASYFSSLPSFHSTNSNDISYSFDTRESLSSNSSPSSPIVVETHQLQKFMIPSSNSRSTHCIIYSDTNNCDQLEHDVRDSLVQSSGFLNLNV
ncbi:trafficking protein particle complex subunit 9 [Caerostris extrusa]|uniref:Trafficking protein particle complex subunit 9 n=1 Tax=Caerostris extrusa TaxID=172846 RepID=A0AAV4N7Y1_CAEEX|nr:trafficking protein particle complex subunit 9 [Caerostris extrusa]